MELPALMFNPKTKKPIIVLKGLNRKDLISDDELSSCRNISFSLHSPLISHRPPRETMNTLSSPQALFSVGDNLAWVDGTDFVYNGTVKGSVTADAKSMVNFNGKILIFPDKKYYDYGSDTFGTITDTGPDHAVPDIDYVCQHMNRVFGVKGNTVYSSAWGKYNDWSTKAGVSTDSWAKDLASEGGNIVGIVSYQNHPVIFKEELMYEVYNNKPDFVTQPVFKIGALSSGAMLEANKVLYFVDKGGVYSYRGGEPFLVSDKLNEIYSDAVLGTDGRLLYVSLYNGMGWNLYIYDTLEGKWWQEDDLQVIQFTKIDGYAHALSADGKLCKLNSGTELFDWEIETNEMTDELFKNKDNRRIYVSLNLSSGSIANIYVKYDNGGYVLVKSISRPGLWNTEIPLKPKMARNFQVKITGEGEFRFHGFQRDIATNSK